VFPDSDTPSLPILLRAAESAGLEVRDVENLREHYASTLRHWFRRLESPLFTEALSYVDESDLSRLALVSCRLGAWISPRGI
jgi:cyclopropane-fatty-acyl-phospholipid synthase